MLHVTRIVNAGTSALPITIVFAVCVLLLVAVGIVLLIHLYCGRRNEYDEIVDADEEPDVEMMTSSTPCAANHAIQGTEKTPTMDAASVLVSEIDYTVRHMEGFYATGYYCSVVSLEKQLNLPARIRKKSIREFIRKRPEFRMRSNLSAFKVTRLTPFRELNVQVAGKFQCVNVVCKHKWNSLCTFADHYQKCKRCSARVYPYEQNALTAIEMAEFNKDTANENFMDCGDVAQAAR